MGPQFDLDQGCSRAFMLCATMAIGSRLDMTATDQAFAYIAMWVIFLSASMALAVVL